MNAENTPKNTDKAPFLKKPDWLRKKLPDAYAYASLKQKLKSNKLHTICESGLCPNIGECWNSGTATFMILGDICTRSCRFCNVKTGKPLPPDFDEPEHLASVVKEMGLKHVVLTSVDRDDLPDGGAEVWAQTINAVKKAVPGITIECLIPDFKGSIEALTKIVDQKPNIISHNLETVKRLTSIVRVYARYDVSLNVLGFISKAGIAAKSGIMLGLGETHKEILDTMDDLLQQGCSILTLGQYLRPSAANMPVVAYIPPKDFEMYKEIAMSKGFKFAECGPLVRSSYHAEKHL